jgi:hypothetical protein
MYLMPAHGFAAWMIEREMRSTWPTGSGLQRSFPTMSFGSFPGPPRRQLMEMSIATCLEGVGCVIQRSKISWERAAQIGSRLS